MRYSFVSPEFLTVEEAREWVFCIAYFLQETEIDIKPPPIKTEHVVETNIIVPDVEDAIEIEDWSFSDKDIERRVLRLYRGSLTIFKLFSQTFFKHLNQISLIAGRSRSIHIGFN